MDGTRLESWERRNLASVILEAEAWLEQVKQSYELEGVPLPRSMQHGEHKNSVRIITGACVIASQDQMGKPDPLQSVALIPRHINSVTYAPSRMRWWNPRTWRKRYAAK